MEFLYELQPQFDSRKSFYGKANVYKKGNKLVLISYATEVAEINPNADENQPKIKINGWYSYTTARHINEFLRQYGFNSLSKKDMEGGVIY